MQHLQNPFYNESDTSAADQIERVGPIANIFFPDDNNETLHKHSLTESDERSATSSSCYDVQKYDHISEEIWSPEQLDSASAEDERPDTAAKVGPKLELHNQIVWKSMILLASLKY